MFFVLKMIVLCRKTHWRILTEIVVLKLGSIFNYLGNFKKYKYLGVTHSDSNLINQECSMSIRL